MASVNAEIGTALAQGLFVVVGESDVSPRQVLGTYSTLEEAEAVAGPCEWGPTYEVIKPGPQMIANDALRAGNVIVHHGETLTVHEAKAAGIGFTRVRFFDDAGEIRDWTRTNDYGYFKG